MNMQVKPLVSAASRQLPFEVVALVLQGGGALGAYQAGVFEALAEAGIQPNWIAGTRVNSPRHCERKRSNPEATKRRAGLRLPSLFELRRTRSSQGFLAMTG
jgi:hypothetical protein